MSSRSAWAMYVGSQGKEDGKEYLGREVGRQAGRQRTLGAKSYLSNFGRCPRKAVAWHCVLSLTLVFALLHLHPIYRFCLLVCVHAAAQGSGCSGLPLSLPLPKHHVRRDWSSPTRPRRNASYFCVAVTAGPAGMQHPSAIQQPSCFCRCRCCFCFCQWHTMSSPC